MKISGTKSEVSKVTIDVKPQDVLEDLDRLIRGKLGIKHGFTRWNSGTCQFELCQTEYSHHNGDPYDEVIDKNPSQETIVYIRVFETFENYLREATQK